LRVGALKKAATYQLDACLTRCPAPPTERSLARPKIPLPRYRARGTLPAVPRSLSNETTIIHREEDQAMLKKLTLLLSGVVLALAMPAAAQAGKTYYWISHGSPADPVWTYFLAGAKQWASDTGNTVNTSFHNGQVAPQQEAVRAAIAAKADGIVTSSPDP